jgi:hypothetical protein
MTVQGLFDTNIRRGVRSKVKATSFAENVDASYKAAVDNDLMFSEENLIREQTKERNQALFNALGVTPEDIYNQRNLDTNRQYIDQSTVVQNEIVDQYLEEQKKRNPNNEAIQGLKNSIEVRDAAIQQAIDSRNKAADVSSRATTLGSVGGFLGAVGGSATDRVNVATMFMGAGASSSILKTFLTEAAIGAGTEAIIQPHVADLARQTGQEYGFDNFLTNVTLAGLLSGTVGTGISKGKEIVGKSKNIVSKLKPSDAFDALANNKNIPLKAREAAEHMADVARVKETSPFELKTSVDRQAHIKNSQKVIDGFNAGKRLDEIDFEIPKGAKLKNSVDVDTKISVVDEQRIDTPDRVVKAKDEVSLNKQTVITNDISELEANYDDLQGLPLFEQELAVTARIDTLKNKMPALALEPQQRIELRQRERADFNQLAKDKPDLQILDDDGSVIKASDFAKQLEAENQLEQVIKGCALGAVNV